MQTKQLFMWAHLLIASVLMPFIIMAAVSGGLYLIGIKGKTEKTAISLPAGTNLDFKSDALKSEVKALLNQLNLDDGFEYIKNRGKVIQTRPTSRAYYEFKQTDNGLTLSSVQPDFAKTMIELHKGHGPLSFKLYQKIVAVALILVMLSGVYLGLTNPRLRKSTVTMLVVGTALFLGLTQV